MNRKVKKLLKNFILFLGLLALGRLADNLPDAPWSLVLQIGVYGSALFVGISLLTSINRDLGNHDQEEESKIYHLAELLKKLVASVVSKTRGGLCIDMMQLPYLCTYVLLTVAKSVRFLPPVKQKII